MEVKKNSAFVASIDMLKLCELMEAVPELGPLSYETMSDAIGRDVRNGARHIMESARRRVQEQYGIVFICDRTKGLRRLANEEIAPHASEEGTGKIRRTAHRSIKQIEAADYDKLSNDQRIAHNVARSWLGALHLSAKPNQRKEIERRVAEAHESLPFAKTLEAFKK